MASNPNSYIGPLPDGVYTIRNVHYPKSVVDLRGQGIDNGTRVVSNHMINALSQQWVFESGARGYKIMNAETRAYLSYAPNETPRYALPITANHNNPVEWIVVQERAGYQFRLALDDNMVLDLWGAAPRDQENCDICFCGRYDSIYSIWNCNPVPNADRNIDELTKSIDELKNQLAASQKTMEDTQKRIAGVETSVARVQQDVTLGQEAVADIRRLADLAQRFPALEAKTGKLATSFGQTRDYLDGVQALLRTTKRELTTMASTIPGVEAKTDQTAESFLELQSKLSESLKANEDRLNELDKRVIVVEGRTDQLSDSLDKIRSTSGEVDGETLGSPSDPEPSDMLFAARAPSLLHQADELPKLPDRLD